VGVRCWIAPRNIRPGREYASAIMDAIDSARLMVLIFSSHANVSPQIHREIERAVSKGLTIIPVRIEEILPTSGMQYFLGSIHWLDAITPPIAAHLDKLAETVKANLESAPGHAAGAPATVVPPPAPAAAPSARDTDAVHVGDPAAAAKGLAAGRGLVLGLVGVAAAGAIGAGIYFWSAPAQQNVIATAPQSSPPGDRAQPARKIGPLSSDQAQQLKAGETFQECTDCPAMTVVPAGEFVIGSPANESGRELSEGPQQRILFSRSFAVGTYAATFAEWNACIAAGGCNAFRPGDYGWGAGDRPVINVSWADARAYVEWLSAKTGAQYRLLSEAEREYVTRACNSAQCYSAPFWFGAEISPDLANYDWRYSYGGGRKAQPPKQTLPVASFKANPWGIFQVHGNVREWMEDCWNPDLSTIPQDGSARRSGDCRSHVVRGGSWADEPKDLRSAKRSWELTDERKAEVGFRVARSLGR